MNTESQYYKQVIAQSFNKAYRSYEQVAELQKEVGLILLERVRQFCQTKPTHIIDIGCGPGLLAPKLQKRFPDSIIILTDIAEQMLHYSSGQNPECKHICLDAEYLPLADNSCELIFSNMTIQWCQTPEKVFSEFHRILKPGGQLFFSTVGPATLHELKHAWRTIDHFTHVNDFIDMYTLGDMMLASGFSEPVVDIENFTLTYASVLDLLKDLKLLGSTKLSGRTSKGLWSRNQLKQLQIAYQKFQEGNSYPASYEIIFGFARKSTKPLSQTPSEYVFPIEKLSIKNR